MKVFRGFTSDEWGKISLFISSDLKSKEHKWRHWGEPDLDVQHPFFFSFRYAGIQLGKDSDDSRISVRYSLKTTKRMHEYTRVSH